MLARFEGKEDSGESEKEIPTIEVLECNWTAVEVFQRCALQWVSGMRAICLGVSASEIGAVVFLMRLPRAERPQILRDVFFMGAVAARVLNGKG